MLKAHREIVALQVMNDSNMIVLKNDQYSTLLGATVRDFYINHSSRITRDDWSEILQMIGDLILKISTVLVMKIKILGWAQVGKQLISLVILLIKKFKNTTNGL